MKLFINGEERQLEVTTVSTLVEQLGMKADRVAVELNREIVPRADWPKTALRDGDKLEIVHFVGGGLCLVPYVRPRSGSPTRLGSLG
ncbi:MAG: sulfur carrier protein ThiS [Candidatus Korobacteraceae bacterium]|jgi:thiamine biosynthesis protein ThiS